MKKHGIIYLFGLLSFTLAVQNASGQQAADPSELAKKLANPVAALISVPFQNNTDFGIGDNNGTRNTLNFQPVIPISLSPKLTLITRTILPLVSQLNVTGNGTSQTGLGDISLSAFFAPASDNIVWAIGPIFSIPAATNSLLGSQKWSMGPTGIILSQGKFWTVGALVNQTWSVAGSSDRAAVSQLFMQPFISRRWKSGANIGLNAEISENWTNSTSSAFLNPAVGGVTKLGSQVVSLSVGPRIPISAPPGSMADFGVRAVLTFVFPK